MSLAVHPEAVESVLLADGWHNVEKGTFMLDAYEYVDDEGQLWGGGTGLSFVSLDDGRYRLTGPMTAVLAVRRMVTR